MLRLFHGPHLTGELKLLELNCLFLAALCLEVVQLPMALVNVVLHQPTSVRSESNLLEETDDFGIWGAVNILVGEHRAILSQQGLDPSRGKVVLCQLRGS